jgi:hypothetical protein
VPHALVLNCTLQAAPEASNTEALARVVIDALGERGARTELVRVLDHDVRPGVSSERGRRRVAGPPRADPRRGDPRGRDAHVR